MKFYLIDDDQNIINILKLIIQNRNLGEIYDHNIRLYIFQIIHCIFCIETCPADFPHIAVLNDQQY